MGSASVWDDHKERTTETGSKSDGISEYGTAGRIEDHEWDTDGTDEGWSTVAIERTTECNGDTRRTGGRVLEWAKDFEHERELESKTELDAWCSQLKGASDGDGNDVELDVQDTVEWDCVENEACRDVQAAPAHWITEIERWSDAAEPCGIISERSRRANNAHDRVIVLEAAIEQDTEGKWTKEATSELEGVSEVVGGGRCGIGINKSIAPSKGWAAEEGEDATEPTVDETAIRLEGAGEADDDVDIEGEGEVNASRDDDERSIDGECLNVDVDDGSRECDHDASRDGNRTVSSGDDAASPCIGAVEVTGCSSSILHETAWSSSCSGRFSEGFWEEGKKHFHPAAEAIVYKPSVLICVAPVSETSKKKAPPADMSRAIPSPTGWPLAGSYMTSEIVIVVMNVAPPKKLNWVPNGIEIPVELVAEYSNEPKISNVNEKVNWKPKSMPGVPSWKVPPTATVMMLNWMSRTPLSETVSRTKPVEMYKPHPPTESQKSNDGAMPPSHVPSSVNDPDALTMHMIES